jgi:hypothetical protein
MKIFGEKKTFTGHEVSLVQNFICTTDFRLNLLKSIVPKWAETLNPYPVVINYDSDINVDEVYSLYDKYFDNLYFQQDIGKEWREPVQDLLNLTDSPYILYLCEDYTFAPELTRERFLSVLDEYKSENCAHLMLTRVRKYTELKWHTNSRKGNHLWLYHSSESPYDSFPAAGLIERNLYKDSLKDAPGMGLSGLDHQERSGIKHRNVMCCSLIEKLMDHEQPAGTAQRYHR